MEQFAHVAGMILHVEFLVEDVGEQGRGPDSGVQAVSHRPAFNKVVQLLALGAGQFAGASAAVAFLDPFKSIFIPVADPSMDARAVDMKQHGDGRGGVAVEAQEDGLQAQGDARGFVSLGLLAQTQDLAARARLGLGEEGSHGRNVVLLMRG